MVSIRPQLHFSNPDGFRKGVHECDDVFFDPALGFCPLMCYVKFEISNNEIKCQVNKLQTQNKTVQYMLQNILFLSFTRNIDVLKQIQKIY